VSVLAFSAYLDLPFFLVEGSTSVASACFTESGTKSVRVGFLLPWVSSLGFANCNRQYQVCPRRCFPWGSSNILIASSGELRSTVEFRLVNRSFHGKMVVRPPVRCYYPDTIQDKTVIYKNLVKRRQTPSHSLRDKPRIILLSCSNCRKPPGTTPSGHLISTRLMSAGYFSSPTFPHQSKSTS
jgi:hypothetical protein